MNFWQDVAVDWQKGRVYIPQEDLLAGRWADHVEALLQQPPPPERPRVDGAEVAAEETLNLVIG